MKYFFQMVAMDEKGKITPVKGSTRVVTKDSDETVQGVLVPVAQKNFSTGSRGWHGQAKVELEGATAIYQTQVQLVEIGSKKLAVTPQAVVKASQESARNAAELGTETNGRQPDVNIITALASQPAALQAYLASFK